MTCDQPPNSICHTYTPQSSTCEVVVVQARFSDDLLSVIIKFDFPLNLHIFIFKLKKIFDIKYYRKLLLNYLARIHCVILIFILIRNQLLIFENKLKLCQEIYQTFIQINLDI
ncbi:unnamed protein product [Paramecium sonneborni]|uniref:Transmembrane protein n=1 Tax=Paramecium sonneborni TaxID=65129 RepID=A0A8S1RPN7_9CILI|nr:unnamed protein product [Paramecium sonneborni]